MIITNYKQLITISTTYKTNFDLSRSNKNNKNNFYKLRNVSLLRLAFKKPVKWSCEIQNVNKLCNASIFRKKTVKWTCDIQIVNKLCNASIYRKNYE